LTAQRLQFHILILCVILFAENLENSKHLSFLWMILKEIEAVFLEKLIANINNSMDDVLVFTSIDFQIFGAARANLDEGFWQ